jgi:hypothetical protein
LGRKWAAAIHHTIPPKIQTAYHSVAKPAPTAASHSNPVQSCRYQNNLGSIHGKSRDCASAASRGAQPDAVTGRDVRPSNLRDRVFEPYGSIPQVKPTDPNRFGSFTAQNGAGAASTLGKGERSSAETQSDDFSSRQKENRGGTKGTVGEVEGGEKEISSLDWANGLALAYRLKYTHTASANKTIVTIQRDEPLISVFLAIRHILSPTSRICGTRFRAGTQSLNPCVVAGIGN